jgi:hypothetical protein
MMSIENFAFLSQRSSSCRASTSTRRIPFREMSNDVVHKCAECERPVDLLPVLFILFDKGGIPRSLWIRTLARWKELFETDEPLLWRTLVRVDAMNEETRVAENQRRARSRSKPALDDDDDEDSVTCGVVEETHRQLWLTLTSRRLEGFQLRFTQRRLHQLIIGLLSSFRFPQ